MSHYRTTSSETLYRGTVVTLRIDRVEVEGRRTLRREVVEHRGAVVMAPLDGRGRLLMVRQYRHAVGRELLELPAGTLDPGEDPAQTAQRELQEEIGFAAGSLEPMGGFFSAPGFCNEYLHFFIARDLHPGSRPHDPDEEINVEPVTVRRAIELVRRGEIQDAKSIAGLYLLQLARAPKR